MAAVGGTEHLRHDPFAGFIIKKREACHGRVKQAEVVVRNLEIQSSESALHVDHCISWRHAVVAEYVHSDSAITSIGDFIDGGERIGIELEALRHRTRLVCVLVKEAIKAIEVKKRNFFRKCEDPVRCVQSVRHWVRHGKCKHHSQRFDP